MIGNRIVALTFMGTLMFVLNWAGPVVAETRVFFDKDEYVVSSVGEMFEVQILIDADDATSQIEPVRTGLFSFGAEVSYESTKAQVVGSSALETASPLDFFQFVPGALTEVDAGRAASKGNIDQVPEPVVPYTGSLLMKLTMTNLASPTDLYPLELDFFRTLGDTEQIFLNGAGGVLDDDIVFGRAWVRVVPEPTAAVLSLLAVLPLAWQRRRATRAGML